jgi:hypothetical protein
MRGVYTAGITITGLSSSKTLLLVQPPSTVSVEILSISLTKTDSETSEQLICEVSFVKVLGSPSGSSITPAKHEIGDHSSGSTITGNLTVEPTSYLSPVDRQGFNNLAGYRYNPIPEERPVIKSGSALGLRMISTPTPFDAYAQVVYREIG